MKCIAHLDSNLQITFVEISKIEKATPDLFEELEQ